MKRLYISMYFVLIACAWFAYPVYIQSWNLDSDAQAIEAMHISVDAVNRQTGSIVAYVRNAEEHAMLRANGYNAITMPKPGEYNDDSKDPTRAYYSITQYHTFMQDTAAQYPEICQLVQFGTSVENRPLYMMKISDNVGVEEFEPELKYVSSIHGDEVVGYEMLIRLIQLLTTEYTTTPRITDIVNNTEIWICPMFNPDGYASSERYNANGIDLNRNYPMPTGNQHPDGNAWAQENIAMMSFSQAHSFNLSMNFHGGALVINYPWDYTYTLAPDDALLQEMSLTYTRPHTNLYNSSEFEHGITNGAAWYVITGSMQDWMYGYTDCIDITAEIGMNKWPPSSQLTSYWNMNKESLLRYIEFSQNGVKGLVTTAAGAPLYASISVSGNNNPMHTDPDVGDYHRLLLPGDYQITVTVDGYDPQTVSVSVPSTGFALQNFTFGSAVAVSDEQSPLLMAQFLNNYPNPFTNETMLRYRVEKDNMPITLSVYNLKGQLIKTVVNSIMDSGEHSVVFNGAELASGIYLCRLQSPDGTQTKKIVLR
jgi:hypothetical protein